MEVSSELSVYTSCCEVIGLVLVVVASNFVNSVCAHLQLIRALIYMLKLKLHNCCYVCLGMDCSEAVDVCRPNPCPEPSVCVSDGLSYDCQCPPGIRCSSLPGCVGDKCPG